MTNRPEQIRDSSTARFTALFSEHEVAAETGQVRLVGRYLYLADERSGPDDLLSAMVDAVTEFCIPAGKVIGADAARLEELRQIAVRKFIEAERARHTSGEPGELLLYLLLDRLLGAPKIASKMYLKTSRNVPVHGCDAVHARLRTVHPPVVDMYWGESKLHANLATGVRESVESVYAMQPGSSAREDDVLLVREQLSAEDLDSDLEDVLVALLDPYQTETRDGPALYDNTACFVGFDSRPLQQLRAVGTDSFRTAFLNDYALAIQRACRSFCEKAVTKGIGELRYTLVLLPFDSVAQFRRSFYERLDASR